MLNHYTDITVDFILPHRDFIHEPETMIAVAYPFYSLMVHSFYSFIGPISVYCKKYLLSVRMNKWSTNDDRNINEILEQEEIEKQWK